MVADASLCLCWAVMRVRWRFWRTNYLTLSPSRWLVWLEPVVVVPIKDRVLQMCELQCPGHLHEHREGNGMDAARPRAKS